MKHLAYLSVGSNLGDLESNLNSAIDALSKKGCAIIRRSSYIKTKPWGYTSCNDFLNAAISVETHLTPQELLLVTRDIEISLGRKEKSHDNNYSDRIIDLDILLYDDMVVCSPTLTLPHPLMHKRRFVLEPLAEIAPHLKHPVLKRTMAQLLSALEDDGEI